MKVKFSTADEFLAELSKECSSASGPYAIDDQILRLTYSYRQDPHVPLRYLSVVAGVVIRGKVVELHGVQDYHWLICDAVGIAQTWYQGGTTGQNSLLRTTPP
jgi:hypothetical protein